jgi:uncharacterized YigZ family protein
VIASILRRDFAKPLTLGRGFFIFTAITSSNQMATESDYFTIEQSAMAQTIVKGSKFIANAEPVVDKEGAENMVAGISAKFRDATHNCFAYRIGIGDAAVFRFSDAGEPSGTAGRPILQAIESKSLTNVAVVVTRYFGGTKLGAGGLVRAYHASAMAALNQAAIIRCYRQIKLRVTFSFEFTSAVHQLLNKFPGEIVETRFSEKTEYVIQLKAKDVEAFSSELADATSGRVGIEKQ